MKTIVFLLLAAPAMAQELPMYTVAQGHVVVISLDPATCHGQTLETMGRQWRCEPDGRLLVAVAYNDPAARYDLTVLATEESHLLATISVVPTEYKRDEKPGRGRPAQTTKRGRERAAISEALASGETNYPELTLVAPLRAPLDEMQLSGDPFGLHRDWVARAGKRKKRRVVDRWFTRHEGIDQRAPTGTLVRAAGDGFVVYAERASAEGRMVIVYHGSGVYSLSLHLSRIKVRVGDRVTSGQTLGASGATGMASGAHLHYAIKVGGVYVDPDAFIETINRDWN